MRPTDEPPGSSSGNSEHGVGGAGAGDPRIDSTERAVAAVVAVAERYGRQVDVEHSIGADQSGRRLAAGAFTVTDPDGSLPHEAFIELPGRPEVQVQVFSEGDATVTVDEVEFSGVPRAQLPAFLDSVYGGRAWVRARTFTQTLIIPLPGDVTYKELLLGPWSLTPWLRSVTR
ncbi:hypothetical protein [Streptomyces sp. NPDC057702]|uniref:hypothetical protein n=1 Tax=unclassified Streptomyces TaxID=2593676 RepID=UPI003698FF0B